MKKVTKGELSGDPTLLIAADDSSPALRILHEGTGNALEVVSGASVLYSIDKSGVPSTGGATAAGISVFNAKTTYGATGLGVADDTAAIQAAITAASAAGGGVVYLPEGSYRITGNGLVGANGVSLVGAGMDRTTIVGDDAGTDNPYINYLGGPEDVSVAFTAPVNEHDRTITVTSTAGMAVGQDCALYGGHVPDANGRAGTFYTRIAKVNSGTVITLDESSPYAYATTDAFFTPQFKVKTTSGRQWSGFHIADIAFKIKWTNDATPATVRSTFLKIQQCKDFTVARCRFEGCKNVGLWIVDCKNAMVRDNLISRNVSIVSGSFGATIDDSTRISVIGNHFQRNGQSLCFTRANFCSAIGNTITNAFDQSTTSGVGIDDGGRGIKLIDDCRYIIIDSNNISDVAYDGVHTVDSSYNTISNNMLHHCGWSVAAPSNSIFVVATDAAATFCRDNLVIGNKIVWSGGMGIAMNGTSGSIVGNTVKDVAKSSSNNYGIYLDPQTSGGQYVVTGNNVTGMGASGQAIRVQTGGGHLIVGNMLKDAGGSFSITTSPGTGANKIGLNHTGAEFLDNLSATDQLNGWTRDVRAALTYSASITPIAANAEYQTLTVTNGTAFTINAPTLPTNGARLVFEILNSSGGAMGVITWNAVFKMPAFTNPGNTLRTTIEFRYNGSNWVQTGAQSPAF